MHVYKHKDNVESVRTHVLYIELQSDLTVLLRAWDTGYYYYYIGLQSNLIVIEIINNAMFNMVRYMSES